MIGFLLGLSRPTKRLVQVLADAVLLVGCFVAAVWLRFDHLDPLAEPAAWLGFAAVVPISLLIFVGLGFYRAIIRYIGHATTRTVGIGVGASAAVFMAANLGADAPLPRSVPPIYGLLAFLSVGAMRLAAQHLLTRRRPCAAEPVILYGAGASGRQVLRLLRATNQEYRAVAFIDDDPRLHRTAVDDLDVHPPRDIPALAERYGARTLLLTMPSLPLARRTALLRRLSTQPVEVRTIPGIADLVEGRARIDDIRPVEIEDLLGRAPVPADPDLMTTNVTDRVVLVSGAGGSIGSELCRQVLRLRPRRLVLLEQSEYALYAIVGDLDAANGDGIEIVPVLGSVLQSERVEATLRRNDVETVFHAAAYKHVPLVEANEIEGVRNNAFGTATIARAAAAAGVGAFILISTDKAVRPTNVMGASKRLAELVCQALAVAHPRTTFSMVRFGNVLGSSGSVIPLFRDQIAKGGPVTVTHEAITRYFMTIPEAAQLVIQAGAMAKGGDVFVLDMGAPVRIIDMAERMVRLSGLSPFVRGSGQTGDIEIAVTGLRPGEKLYEELLIADATGATDHPRIMTATERSISLAAADALLADLDRAMEAHDPARVRRILRDAPLGYAAPHADPGRSPPTRRPAAPAPDDPRLAVSA